MSKSSILLKALTEAIIEETRPSTIGRTWYPIDNSYNKCLTSPSKNRTFLAGTAWEMAKKCEIISEPFEMKHNFSIINKEFTHTFVMVKYQSDIFLVLFQYNWLDFNQDPVEKLMNHHM